MEIKMSKTIKVDGSMGEGGGQVLRTSLTLAMLKQVKIEIVNIRAKRNKPGLLRQHLTCVRAAQAICNGEVEGDELGSQRILFTPGNVKGGDYHFAIGTAGSTSLVCQTILLPLALAGGESRVTFEGGTHNGMSPSVTFLEQSFLPILASMGIQTEIKLKKLGFYPAGGGKWSLTIKSNTKLEFVGFEQSEKSQCELADKVTVTAVVSQLPESIGQREIDTVIKSLQLNPSAGNLLTVNSPGPGNTLIIAYDQGNHSSVFEVVGELGVSAEKVAKRSIGRLRKLLKATADVEEHLADQLLLPMAVAGKGRFTTTEPSLHTKTNIDVIRLFGFAGITTEQLSNTLWRIEVSS